MLSNTGSDLFVKNTLALDRLTAPLPALFIQAVADFPQLLCQGLGRSARIAFLLRAPSSTCCTADENYNPQSATGSGESENDDEDAVACSSGGDAGGVVGDGAKLMSAADACSEVCRRVTDFASDNPAYPAFVDHLLSEACQGAGGEDPDFVVGDKLVLSSDPPEEGVAASSSGPAAALDHAAAGAALEAGSRIDSVLIGNQRQRYQWREWQNARRRGDDSARGSDNGGTISAVITTTAMPSSVSTADSGGGAAMGTSVISGGVTSTSVLGGGIGEGEGNTSQTPSQSAREEGSRDLPSPTPSPVANELAVMGERALGAALTAVATESGGKAVATMLLPPVHRKGHR